MPEPVLRAHPGWSSILAPETRRPSFRALVDRLRTAEAAGPVYPPLADRFNALQLGPENVRVVILGQDPYHGAGQAHGLAFSVRPGVAAPRSLRNVFTEIEREGLGAAAGRSGDLTPWVRQGVLLLNTCLTVNAGQPGSHQGWGWEPFTDRIIQHLATTGRPRAFLLWGRFAQQKAPLVDASRHLVLQSAHPSPFSADRGFFGNGHFQQVNAWLGRRAEPPIRW